MCRVGLYADMLVGWLNTEMWERDIDPTDIDLRDYYAVLEVTMELDEPPKK